MEYKIKSRLWIETNNQVLLGEGRIQLLKAIADTRSLSKAAKRLNMSYKKAWNLIDSINTNAKTPVVSKSIGGKGGGGTIITAHGKHLIEIFDNINKRCWEFLDKELEQANL
ncbi:MAG: LysR family transcriptional regulator [Flavobacteriaceae bacterium]|nr:LysR family transcriptional regulator [Flavobacteriaceae bacterium]